MKENYHPNLSQTPKIKMLSTPKAKAELFLASSLYDGLEDNNIMQVTTLLLNKEADPNVLIPSQGITPFHLVIGNDSETFAEEVTKLFLRHGGNPNIKSVDGMTPVHVAAAWGRLGVLELLLSNGGDPLLVDNDGRSPFHYAFDEAHYDAVATLGKYCGEPFEEDSDLKYNIVLDKILVSNGGIVAEYAVSKDSNSTLAENFATISTSQISNNNERHENLNPRFIPSTKIENYVHEWHSKYPGGHNVTTTTADETSASLLKFVDVRRHRKCLPRKNVKNVQYTLGNMDTLGRKELDLLAQDYHAQSTITKNQLCNLHLNDLKEEVSFCIEAKKDGENMPRISSPKVKKKLAKSKYYPEIFPQNNHDKNDWIRKTPLGSCSKKIPLATIKKTPTEMLGKQVNYLSSRTTPNSGKFHSNINRALIRTPSRYTSKEGSYQPDCSIVSKSPNLIGTTKTTKTPKTPTNNYKLQDARKIVISNRGLPSAKALKIISPHGASHKTPPPSRVHNEVNCGKNFPRFVKQSELRYEVTKKTPKSSPSRFRKSPIRSNKAKRTPNLTDSTKHKKIISAVRSKANQIPSYTTLRSPSTPLNKTYSKDRLFDAAALSPEVEINNRFVDRRTLYKKIAVKLEETMYDDNYENDIVCADRRKISPIVTSVESDVTSTGNPEFPQLEERQVSNVTDESLNRLDSKINTGCFNANEYVKISGIHELADPTKVNDGETVTSVDSLQLYNNARHSKVVAGFFQSCGVDGGSIGTTNVNSIMNNAITSPTSKLDSNISADNLLRTENPVNSAACLKQRYSKEIDDSLISSDLSSYTRDPTNLLNLGDTGLSIEPKESSKSRTNTHGNGAPKCELSLPHLTSDTFSTDIRKNCSALTNESSGNGGSNYMSFVSVEEEYKYEDVEEGVILFERRLLITPVSIPIVKTEDGIASSEKSSQSSNDESTESRVSSLPHSLVIMDSDTLRRELTRLDQPPGPITATTRHVYLKRLRKLQKHGSVPSHPRITVSSKFSTEIERTLRSENWMSDLSSYEALERQVFSEFANPDPTRRWREGIIKSSFNYLLMDPRVTDNLPQRANILSSVERWQTFLSSIFYVGKGRRSRPYAHLYEAYGEWKKDRRDTSDKKVNHILDIWNSNCGVVCLHLYQNTIPAEAYTREAAMIDALGLDKLKNLKAGDYYGVASTWSHHQKRMLGVYLLYKAMHILINEGERQLSPDDIGR